MSEPQEPSEGLGPEAIGYLPKASEPGDYCGVIEHYTCTRSKGHSGDHAGHGRDGRMYHRWPQEGPPADPFEQWAAGRALDSRWLPMAWDAAVAAERERCAKACEEMAAAAQNPLYETAFLSAARRIRQG